METELHWSIWLLSGMAVGLLAGVGKGGLSGTLLAVGILVSPALIFMKAGAAPLPFALFYGGLVAVSSFLFRRRNAKRDAEMHKKIADNKKRMGL
jgi:hypothetical protein